VIKICTIAIEPHAHRTSLKKFWTALAIDKQTLEVEAVPH